MLGTILLILAIWFLVSIPFSLFVGRVLALNHSSETEIIEVTQVIRHASPVLARENVSPRKQDSLA